MKKRITVTLFGLLWSWSTLLAPSLEAAHFASQVSDVALQQNGTLHGKLVDAQGRPLARTAVSVSMAGKDVGSTLSDSTGSFQIAGLQGGVVEIKCQNSQVVCRAWAESTAPPQAQRGILIVDSADVVRGQNCGNCVGCGSGVCGGHGGGLLGIMADRPLVAAGVIGAAIAIPIAVSNNSSPSTP